MSKDKMYCSTLIENVKLFKDFKFKMPWGGLLGYDVEFIGQKARVICRNPFVKKNVSRLNKVNPIGKTTSGYHYQLTVNGKQVFFIVEHNIFE